MSSCLLFSEVSLLFLLGKPGLSGHHEHLPHHRVGGDRHGAQAGGVSADLPPLQDREAH